MITEERLEALIDIFKIQHEETQFRRIPLEAEKELMEKIRLGRYKEIHLPPFERMDENMGPMAVDARTSHVYLVVAAITLFSRTAIDAGANPDDVFDRSDALLFVLSGCRTTEEIHQIYQLSAVTFAKLVHQMQEKPRSYQINRVCNYISRHIFSKITLSEIAESLDLSPNYLCNMFSKEMGISIHNYIQREKTTVACNLLMHTDRSISDIATYMGFQTQSNFSAVFRKWQHMTPSEYRAKEYREVY